MASTKEYKQYISDQLSSLDNIKFKPMMKEFLLYYSDILVGGIYDDRLLVKKVNENEKYEMKEVEPYKGAKTMFLVDEVDNKEILKEIILDTYNGLLIKK